MEGRINTVATHRGCECSRRKRVGWVDAKCPDGKVEGPVEYTGPEPKRAAWP